MGGEVKESKAQRDLFTFQSSVDTSRTQLSRVRGQQPVSIWLYRQQIIAAGTAPATITKVSHRANDICYILFIFYLRLSLDVCQNSNDRQS